MHASAALFVDVCVQLDLWPGGSWPLVTPEEARNVARLFAFAAERTIRQGGVICRHAEGDHGVASTPPHCRGESWTYDRPPGCGPYLPMEVCDEVRDAPLDRTHATYVASGCACAPDEAGHAKRAFEHTTAGIRDAVVFGAGIEHGLDRTVEALLRRRIRVHVPLDAAGAADADAAQAVVARWKRRGVDGTTVAMVERLLAAR